VRLFSQNVVGGVAESGTAYFICLTVCAVALLVPLQASEYKIPIYITETGIADKKDGNRSHMIDEYMRAVSNPSL
jgi:hypothetical protein